MKCRPPKSWKDVRFDNLPTTLILLPWPPEVTWKAWQVDLQVRERAELLGGAGRLCAEVPALGGRVFSVRNWRCVRRMWRLRVCSWSGSLIDNLKILKDSWF